VTVAYLAAFATALFYSVSAVLEDDAAKRVPISGSSGKRAAMKATLSPVYIAGMLLSVLAWSASLVALRTLPLFAVQSIAASSIGLVVLITWWRTKHAPSRFEGIWLIAMGVGLVAIAVSAAPGHAMHTGNVFRISMWVLVVVVAWGASRAGHLRGNRGSAVLGLMSGLADSGLALCARAFHYHRHHPAHLLIDPLALALIPFAVIGMVAFAGALQRGSASLSLACQQGVVTIVPSVVGLLVLGDKARDEFIGLTIAGCLLTVASLIVLTLHTAHHPDDALLPPVEIAPDPAPSG
jgi:hypothetical protein